MTRVVIAATPVSENELPPARVLRQRHQARLGLHACARLSGAPEGGWTQAEGGAPWPNGGWHWSLSHKPRLTAAAISAGPVGVDVEEVAPRRRGLFDEVGSAPEWEAFGERSWPAFFRLWTAKEATLKANSLGIGHLGRCRVLAADGDGCIVGFDTTAWRVQHLIYENHVLALAARDGHAEWFLLREDGSTAALLK